MTRNGDGNGDAQRGRVPNGGYGDTLRQRVRQRGNAMTPNGCLELPAPAPLPLGPENDRRSAPIEGLRWLERRLDRDLLMDA
jgi:hypothetical protein